MFGSNINNFFTAIGTGISNFRFVDALDILLMTVLIFWLISFMRKMGATQLLRGVIFVLIVFYVLSSIFELTMINWLLDKLLISGVIFIAILFQPELRKALGHLGRARQNVSKTDKISDEIVDAVMELSKSHTGALIVIERVQSLQDLCNTGVRLDAVISTELLQNIFVDKTRLHDGAVVIRNGKIEAAACIITLSNEITATIPQQYGTRHRAGVCITNDSDCISIIVSEETGRISYSVNGGFINNVTVDDVRKIVEDTVNGDNDMGGFNLFNRLIDKTSYKNFGQKKEEKADDR